MIISGYAARRPSLPVLDSERRAAGVEVPGTGPSAFVSATARGIPGHLSRPSDGADARCNLPVIKAPVGLRRAATDMSPPRLLSEGAPVRAISPDPDPPLGLGAGPSGRGAGTRTRSPD
eukprot:RCo024586